MAHIVLVLGTILLCVVLNFATEIENPGFFLKVTKNVPRIGRRSEGGQSVTDFDTFFLKASKSVPRIGRSHINNNWPNKENSWIRKIRNENAPQSQSYNFVQPFDMRFLFNLLSEDANVDESVLKFISWKDFDKALESDTQLFVKLVELGKEHRDHHDMKDNDPMIHMMNSGPDYGFDHVFYRTERGGHAPESVDRDQPEYLVGVASEK